MKLHTSIFYLLSILFLFAACKENNNSNIADLILTNGNIYTLAQDQERVEAIAVKEGKILALGTNEEIKKYT
ncbi:MAG: amidohydrolase, partial [Bacteroidota bacterium]